MDGGYTEPVDTEPLAAILVVVVVVVVVVVDVDVGNNGAGLACADGDFRPASALARSECKPTFLACSRLSRLDSKALRAVCGASEVVPSERRNLEGSGGAPRRASKVYCAPSCSANF